MIPDPADEARVRSRAAARMLEAWGDDADPEVIDGVITLLLRARRWAWEARRVA